MDILQLKEVIDLIKSLGAESKQAFIWWLLINNASTYIFGMIWSVIGGLSIWRVINFIMSFSDLEKLRKAVGVEYRFSKNELRKAMNILRDNWNE